MTSMTTVSVVGSVKRVTTGLSEMTSFGERRAERLNRRLDLAKGDNDIDIVGRSRLVHPAAGHVCASERESHLGSREHVNHPLG